MRALGLLYALAGEPTVHVAIDPSAAAELAPDPTLQEWLAARLVEEGWAIGEAGDAQIELRIVARQDALFVEAAAGDRVHAIAIPHSDDGLARLEMLHHAIAALEVVAIAPAANTPAPNEPESIARSAIAVPARDDELAPTQSTRPPTPQAPRAIGVRVHARAGAIGRRAAIDAAISSGLRVGAVPGPAFHLELGVWPSRPTQGVEIVELTPSLGFGWSGARGRRVQVEPMLLAGVLVHVWRYDGKHGAVVDGNFELPIEIAVTLGRGFQLLVVPSIGVATRGRKHAIDDLTVWSRGQLRAGLALGVAWGASWKR